MERTASRLKMKRSNGVFLTLEGIDGCGKTTQARILVGNLASRFGDDAVLWTKEPGGWTGGEKIRDLLLKHGMQHPLSELFLFLADRCEHIREVVAPALEAGKIVVCERYTDSTLAYQSWGRKIPSKRSRSCFGGVHFLFRTRPSGLICRPGKPIIECHAGRPGPYGGEGNTLS